MMRLLIAISFIILLVSCDKEPKPVLVTSQLSYKVDTIFSKQYKRAIEGEMDSLCVANHEEYMKIAMDSILNRDLKDIEALLNE